jgi:hypothetical protein
MKKCLIIENEGPNEGDNSIEDSDDGEIHGCHKKDKKIR